MFDLLGKIYEQLQKETMHLPCRRMVVGLGHLSIAIVLAVQHRRLGGVSPPVTGKSFRFVSCVRARGGMLGENASKMVRAHFPFSLLPREVFPFPL